MLIKRIKNYPNLEPKVINQSLSYLNQKMNKILIIRRYGGVGDLINTMPIFKTIKTLYPGLHITYAIPIQYFGILEDHSYIDKLIDYNGLIDLNEYGYVADISSDCGKYENFKKPLVDKHRSDIWAEMSLGIKLIDHDFCIRLDQKLREKLSDRLINKYKYTTSPRVMICPKSASVSKDIPENILIELIELLKNNNYNPCIIDNRKPLKDYGIPYIYDLTMKEYMHMISIFDYVISVDTGSFHLAAALEIPTVGIFPWTDSKILSKYHSKIVLVQQMHRDNGFPDCPCWEWSQCEHKSKTRIPLPCMQANNANVIFEAFKKLVELHDDKQKTN